MTSPHEIMFWADLGLAIVLLIALGVNLYSLTLFRQQRANARWDAAQRQKAIDQWKARRLTWSIKSGNLLSVYPTLNLGIADKRIVVEAAEALQEAAGILPY